MGKYKVEDKGFPRVRRNDNSVDDDYDDNDDDDDDDDADNDDEDTWQKLEACPEREDAVLASTGLLHMVALLVATVPYIFT